MTSTQKRRRSSLNGATITARICSGLGNQLFQYACGLHISQMHSRVLGVDTSWFDHFQVHKQRRSYQLSMLGLPGTSDEFTKGAARWFLGLAGAKKPVLRRIFQSGLRPLGLYFINEPGLFAKCQELYRPLPAGHVILNGYWQTFDHAEAVRGLMRRTIFSTWKFSTEAAAWRERIRSTKSVFVHVRRGDYKKFGVPLLSADYYRRASVEIQAAMPDAHFYIFSEDMDWASENLRDLQPLHFVRFESQHRDIEDLLLMAECAGGIMANSSFSWWGAALGCELPRPIICPRFWWGRAESDYPDLCFPGWTPLDLT